MTLVSKVGDSLLATKAIGEKPTVFKTKSLDVLLDRQRGSDMGGKKLGEGTSGVALPSASSLFSGQEGEGAPEAVDSQVCYVCHQVWKTGKLGKRQTLAMILGRTYKTEKLLGAE